MEQVGKHTDYVSVDLLYHLFFNIEYDLQYGVCVFNTSAT